MKFFAKIRWIASILLVFFIVLITNLIDRDNYNRLSYSVTTMYEDRIVASDLLFDISTIVKEKQIAFLTSDTAFYNDLNDNYNQQLTELIDQYELTKLTKEEELVFKQLQDELGVLLQKEKSFLHSSENTIPESLEKIDEYLHELSKIQIREGKRQVFISNKAKDTINLFTQGEIIFLIIMAVLVQLIILYNPKSNSTEKVE